MKNMKHVSITIFALCCAAMTASSRERGTSGFSRGSDSRSTDVRASAAYRSSSPDAGRSPSSAAATTRYGGSFTPAARPAETARAYDSGSTRAAPAVTRSYTTPSVSSGRAEPAFRVQRDTASSRPAEVIRPAPEVQRPAATTRAVIRTPEPVREPSIRTVTPVTRTVPTVERPLVQTPAAPLRTRPVEIGAPAANRTSSEPAVRTLPARQRPTVMTPAEPTRTRPVEIGAPANRTASEPAVRTLPARQKPTVLTHADAAARTAITRTPSREPNERLSSSPTATRSSSREPLAATARLTAPNTRLAAPSSTRSTSSIRYGSSRGIAPSLTPDRLTSAVSLRSARQDGRQFRTLGDSQAAVTQPLPTRTKQGFNTRTFADRKPFSSSRYSDGRNSVYHAPERYSYSSRHEPYYRNGHNDHRGHNDHHGNRHHGGWYIYGAFAPAWYCAPVYGSGFAWSNGHVGFSFSSYWPTYYHTRYYDSWSCGGWGYSNLYYGGWRSGWYGGISYIYNPWPVYRTYYLYEPEPVVVRTETVYVNQPAPTSYVVESPAPTAYAAETAVPATYAAAGPGTATQVIQAQPAAAPAVGMAAPSVAEVPVEPCFCPCHCNGQRPCTCAYPCGAEYAVDEETFDLSNVYESYAESLDPETIWSSYAGLDRWDAEADPRFFDATAAADNTPQR